MFYSKFAILFFVAIPDNASRAQVSWEGDSLYVLRKWPKPIREDFGVALGEMQEGNAPS